MTASVNLGLGLFEQIVKIIAGMQDKVQINTILGFGTAQDGSQFVGFNILNTVRNDAGRPCERRRPGPAAGDGPGARADGAGSVGDPRIK